MRVVIDLRPLTGQPYSGVPVYTRHIVKALLRLYPGVEWIGFSSGRRIAAPLLGGFSRIVSERRSSSLALLGSSRAWATVLAMRPNVLFLPNWNILPQRIPLPYVVTFHDAVPSRLPWDGTLKERLWHRAIRIPRVLGQAARILAVSRSSAQELVSFFPDVSPRVTVVRLAAPSVESEHGCGASCPWQKTDLPITVVVGDSHWRKNVASVMAAARSLGHLTRVVAVGNGGIGTLQPRRYAALLSHASVLLYPSLYEGYGFPPQEALALGKRVIIGACPALCEVSGSEVVLVNPLDRAQLLRVWQEMVSFSAHYPPRMPQSSRTWDDVARETMEQLQEAAV